MNAQRGLLALGLVLVVAIVVAILCATGYRISKEEESASTTPTVVQAAQLRTSSSIINYCGASVVEIYSSQDRINDDDGSGSAITIWLVGQGFTQPKNWIIALLPPGTSLDLEAPEISSKTWKLLGSVEQAECAADAVLKDEGVSAYKYSLYTSGLTGDWSNELPSYWVGKPFAYPQKEIFPGGDWNHGTVALDTHKLCAPNGGFMNAQLWNSNVASDTYHPAIEGGYCLSTSVVQGDWWSVTGGFDYRLLVERWHQASSEVFLRDDAPPIHKFWCGKFNDAPTGFATTLPNGWSCQTK